MERVFFFGALQRTPRYFETLFLIAEVAALPLACPAVTDAATGVRGIVVVVVTVATGTAEVEGREGVDKDWVRVILALVLVAITSRG